MRTERTAGGRARAAGLLLVVGAALPAAADDGRRFGAGVLHFGSSDVVPCVLRAHRIDGSGPTQAYVHPSPACDEPSEAASGFRERRTVGTAATWESSYSEVDVAVGVVYRAPPPVGTEPQPRAGETVSIVGAVQYGPLAVGARVFDEENLAVPTVRRGYNLGANYRLGMLRVGTSLTATWSDGSWTGGSVPRRSTRFFDSLSVDLAYLFPSGFTGYFNYFEAHRPDGPLSRRPEPSGQRESIWTIGVSVGF